jgi:hypothetical protein
MVNNSKDRRQFAAAAAPEIGISRERLIRLIQTRAVRGGLERGRWVVDPESLREYVRGEGVGQ